eukprot:SAG22_NODE_377_length_11521_cov_194.091403_3_plen_156_part_00
MGKNIGSSNIAVLRFGAQAVAWVHWAFRRVTLTRYGRALQYAEQDKAFNDLKMAIATAGAVTAYDPTREVIIQVDACRLGVGAVLGQVYGKKLRPVGFFSKAYREPAWVYKGPGTDEVKTDEIESSRRPKQKPGSSKSPQLLELRGIVEAVLHWR